MHNFKEKDVKMGCLRHTDLKNLTDYLSHTESTENTEILRAHRVLVSKV